MGHPVLQRNEDCFLDANGLAATQEGGSAPRRLVRVHTPLKRPEADAQGSASTTLPKNKQQSVLSAPEDENLDDIKIIKLPAYVPRVDRPNESFAALQEWEGVVVSVDPDEFAAELYDITGDRNTAEEIGVFPRAELSQEQNAVLTKGLIFRWAIGFTRKATGRQSRTSIIYFRRNPLSPAAECESAELIFEAE